jgi:ubiquinone/menaquinone biosynthesis C-methylase UbiE
MPNSRDEQFPAYSAPETAAAYLSAVTHVNEVQAYKQLSFDLLQPRPGMRVLDVGSGIGDDARALAPMLAPGGAVVGVDANPTHVSAARARQAEYDGSNVSITFEEGDAEGLPFPDSQFHAVRVDRVLQHVEAPDRVVRELWRVLRPGGRLVIVEPDWKTMAVYPGSAVGGDDEHVSDAVFRWHVAHLPHATIGRQLRALLTDAGFKEVETFPMAYATTRFPLADLVLELSHAGREVVREGMLDHEEVEAWMASARIAEESGAFFASVPLIFACATKPNAGIALGPTEREHLIPADPEKRAENGTTSASVSHRRRHPLTRIGIAALIVLYLGIWTLIAHGNINPTDFDVFFLPSARVALAGHPLHIYQIRYQGDYPNANGPLSMVPLTLLAGLAQRLGWLDDPVLRRELVMTAFAIVPLLLGREAVLAADRLLGAPLRGIKRLLAYALFVLTPELWHSVLFYGHIEQPLMLWLVLAAVRMLVMRRPARAGALLGLALLSRSVALLYLLPLALLLFFRGRRRESVILTTAALAVTALGLLPFLLADRQDVIYSLLTFRGLLIVGGGGVWGLLVGTPLEPIAQRFDSTAVIAASLALTALTLLARRDLRVDSRGVYALLAISGLCFPLFMKTLWPYYYLDTYIFVALWWLTAAKPASETVPWLRWLAGLALPVAVVAVAVLAEIGVTQSGYGIWSPGWSALMSGLMLALLAVVGVGLWRRPRHPRADAAPEAALAGV